eukprot:TRINITY_DN13274_c0_g1_i1.p1 TRINITY_DN13274_c0_g1~~TRINITY_DN13274_c0_g1_i1.p1  ORF type:complete len:316 (+),score=23.70 TRINITY_DN13274_c0_g1_i1:56-949(+)
MSLPEMEDSVGKVAQMVKPTPDAEAGLDIASLGWQWKGVPLEVALGSGREGPVVGFRVDSGRSSNRWSTVTQGLGSSQGFSGRTIVKLNLPRGALVNSIGWESSKQLPSSTTVLKFLGGSLGCHWRGGLTESGAVFEGLNALSLSYLFKFFTKGTLLVSAAAAHSNSLEELNVHYEGHGKELGFLSRCLGVQSANAVVSLLPPYSTAAMLSFKKFTAAILYPSVTKPEISVGLGFPPPYISPPSTVCLRSTLSPQHCTLGIQGSTFFTSKSYSGSLDVFFANGAMPVPKLGLQVNMA